MNKFLYANLSDEELLAYVSQSDTKAFKELHNRYWQVLFAHAHRVLRDEDEAEDVVQEVFLKVWEKSGEIACKTNFSGYLYMTCRNKVLNAIRKRSIQDSFITELAQYAQEYNGGIIEAISVKEINQALDSQMEALPRKMRQVFELSRKKHYTHSEIAEELDISVTTVKKQINNALKIIRLGMEHITLLLPFIFLLKK